jgi:S1-C subfamily serine protease
VIVHRLAPALAFAAFASFVGPAARADAESDSAALRAVHARLESSVVHVTAALRAELANGRALEIERELSGLVVDDAGLVMVPGTMVNDLSSPGERVEAVGVFVAGGDRFDATYVGKDAARNVAFVRVGDARFPGRPVEFAEDDALAVGDFVASVRLAGPSFGRRAFIEAFLVSAAVEAPERCYVTTFAVSDYLGAAVATLDGRIVGVVGWMNLRESTLRRDPVSGGTAPDIFAPVFGTNPAGSEIVIVPASFLRPAIAAPPEPGTERVATRRPFLGVEVQVLLPELRTAMELPQELRGVVVTRVLDGSPAQEAGFAIGDVLHGVDGAALAIEREADAHVFGARIEAAAPGDALAFAVRRGAQEMELRVTLAAAPMGIAEAATARDERAGVTVRDLVYVDRVDRRLRPEQGGAMVTAVSPTGCAGIAGLRVGDIVERVGDRAIADAAALAAALESHHGAHVTLFVRRGRDTLFLDLE